MNTPVPIAVLVIDPSPVNSGLLAAGIHDASGGPIKVRQAPNVDAAVKLQASKPSDVVLLVWNETEVAATAALARLRQGMQQVPVVVICASDDGDTALRWIRSGVQDVLVKRRVSGDAIMRSLHFAVERSRAMTALEALTCLDELTGLYNRRGVLTAGVQVLRHARRRQVGLWVLFADVDGLKSINDLHGHEAGDGALVDVAVALRTSFRASDVLGRLGGDEFVVLAIDAVETSRELLLHRIERNLELRNAGAGASFPLTLSVGCARFEPGAQDDLPALLGRADQDLLEVRRRRHLADGSVLPGRAPSSQPPSR